MKRLIDRFFNTNDIPVGSRLITTITAIRWAGWGFAETLIPILIYSLTSTFAQAGLLRSTYDIGLILTLPIIGVIADKVKATTIILVGLVLYLFVGTSYLLAGTAGLVIFIVIARSLNGVSYALDSVGRETYFRRHTPVEKIATVFGYFDTVANFWWMITALTGIILIKYFSIPWLLFLIVPTSLISFIILWRFKRREDVDIVTIPLFAKEKRKVFQDFKEWNWTLKSLIVFNFFIASASTVIAFFLPIEVYKEGGDLSLVVIMGVVATVPTLFGWILGKWFDIKGSKVFSYGLLGFAVLLFSLVFFHGYIWQLLVSFLVGVILELLSVGSSELVTAHANPEHFGRIGGVIRSISNIGSIVGPLAVGVLMDSYGINSGYLVLAIIMFLLAISFRIIQRNKNPNYSI
jgi:MFS family permease